jgi:hypothetical protein
MQAVAKELEERSTAGKLKSFEKVSAGDRDFYENFVCFACAV